jgi:hypothetical protein
MENRNPLRSWHGPKRLQFGIRHKGLPARYPPQGTEHAKEVLQRRRGRSIEATVEIVVEANSADDAHGTALTHLQARGGECEWKNPRLDLTVWYHREIDTSAMIDVTG